MKTKMKMYRWFLVLVLALSAFGAMAVENQELEQTVCIGVEPYHVEETLPGTFYNWSISGGTSGTNWVLTGNGNDSITVNWMLPGDYTLSIYTSLNGCNGDTTHVLVHVQPPLSITIAPSNPAPICAGMSIPFTSLVPNAGPNATYQWFNGVDPIPGATSSTYTYIGVAPGATITCQVTDPDACAPDGSHVAISNPVVVTVNAQITLTVGITVDNDSICINGTATFTADVDPAVGGLTYQWFNGVDLIPGATASTYLFTGTVTGSYSITCVVSSTDPCVVNSPVTSNALIIVVKPKPTTSLIWHN